MNFFNSQTCTELEKCLKLTSFHVLVLLAFLALSTAAWYSPKWTRVIANLAKLDTLLYRSLAGSYIFASKHLSATCEKYIAL